VTALRNELCKDSYTNTDGFKLTRAKSWRTWVHRISFRSSSLKLNVFKLPIMCQQKTSAHRNFVQILKCMLPTH